MIKVEFGVEMNIFGAEKRETVTYADWELEGMEESEIEAMIAEDHSFWVAEQVGSWWRIEQD